MLGARRHAAFVTRRLKPSPAAATAAAELVQDAGSTWALSAQVIRDACAVAQALVLHSVRHARSELRISLGLADSDLLIDVEDSGDSAPNGRQGPAVGGPGLELIAEFAESSGFELLPTGRRLWALVAIRDELPALPVG